MKFGIVCPVWLYSQQRREQAQRTFESLARTTPGSPASLFVIGRGSRDGMSDQEVVQEIDSLVGMRRLGDSDVFEEVYIIPQSTEYAGTEQTLAWGTERALMDDEVTHVVWMGDDALFNPNWLVELANLIRRHPEARSWSVYRSAHVAYHTPIGESLEDIQVRSICGHGMTFSREEWKAWGIDWRAGQAWPVPSGGNTLDLHHSYHRPGERWVTRRSFVEHTGRTGLHCTPAIPEYAIDFVGE